LKDISFLSISDIHLGNRKNPTEVIVRNLKTYFTEVISGRKLDIIFIGGDIFDRLLTFNSKDVGEILSWTHWLLRFCDKRNIKLRVLEGTPSHDWKQSYIFDVMLKLDEYNLDYKYVQSLSIEYINDFDMNVLYVPDEWTSSTLTTHKQVIGLLKDKNLEKVDIAIMHGAFDYQIPQITKEEIKHSAAEYLNIVRHYICIGHVHRFSFYDRIIAQGSFDRLAHGEEDKKGAVICNINENGNSFDFIENKHATFFKTIELKNIEMDKSLKQIDKIVTKLPADTHVRIKAKAQHPLMVSMDVLKLKYPFAIWSKVSSDNIESDENILSNMNVIEYESVTITAENIITLVEKRMLNQNNQQDLINDTLVTLGEFK
jgi:DNA repair exonuclease SbcCD nuclease subunit